MISGCNFRLEKTMMAPYSYINQLIKLTKITMNETLRVQQKQEFMEKEVQI